MLKTIGRSRFVQQAIGGLMAGYLTLVKNTNRIIFVGDVYSGIEGNAPTIITMWHGQHFMQTFFRKPWHRCYVMISRHGDGEINAIAAEKLGMSVVRGSGAQRKDQVKKRGGIQALRALLGLLEQGEHVSMTADVPKISRVAGEGIIALAQLSGRPLYPMAVVCSRRIDFSSWDAASIGLPFGKTAISVGHPISVPRDADGPTREAIRQALEAELDRNYAQAYAAIGCKDPGANRESVRLARIAQHQKAIAGFATPEGAP